MPMATPSPMACEACTASTLNSLSIRWTAPANTGPSINDYDVQYSEDGGAFTDWPHTGPGTTATITGLKANTPYEVQVLARNDEGASSWSASGVGRTNPNQLPVFTDGSSTTRTLAENTTGVQNIGDPISASDPENTTLTYTLEGTDKDDFTIDTRNGQLRTRSGETYDYETTPRYSVAMKATDGHGGNRSIPVSIDLTDLNEAPVFTGEATFDAAENGLSAGRVEADDLDNADHITDYAITGGANLSLFEISSGGTLTFKDDPDFESPGDAGGNNQYNLAVTATGGTAGRALTTEQAFIVAVTDENEPPHFTSADTFTVTENDLLAGRMAAQDVDRDDPDHELRRHRWG